MTSNVLTAVVGRVSLVVACGALAAATRFALPPPPPPTPEGVAALLGEASGTTVKADDYAWEGSRGWLWDGFFGRPVVFVAAMEGGPRDLFRATVRVSREGHPLAVRSLYRLTDTDLGDEALAARAPERVVVTSSYEGRVLAASAFELAARPVEQMLGALAPAAVRHVVFGRDERAGASPCAAQLVDGELRLALGEGQAAAAVELATGTTTSAPGWWLETWREERHRDATLRERLAALWPGASEEQAVAPSAAAMPTAPGAELGWPPRGEGWAPFADGALARRAVALDAGELVLVAIDTRRLGLGLVAGRHFPRSRTGPAGPGAVPAARAELLVASFPGTTAPGLIDRGRLLAPITDTGARIGVDRAGRAYLGRGPGGDGLSSLRGGGGFASPDRRAPRATLCRTADGYLLYAATTSASASELEAALTAAGCAFSVALRPEGMTIAGETVGPLATPDRTSADDDFFYLYRSAGAPQVGALVWQADGGEQPPPEGHPAIVAATTTTLGSEVQLWLVEANRLEWQIRAGSRETAAVTAAPGLDEEELPRALLAIGLGQAYHEDNQRGLVLDGVEALPMRPFLGALETHGPTGGLAITYTVETMALPGDASELPLLAEGGRLRRVAKELGAHRPRSAACVIDGRLLLALTRHDTDVPETQTLLDLGCRRVVALDRGRQITAFVHRRGLEPAPRGDYEDTILYGLIPERPRGTAGDLP
ncbi:MAG: hypothetical protein R3B72_20345 [Polyangiaceae bacterium]